MSTILTIRQEQLLALENDARKRRAWKVVENLGETSPHSVRGLSEAELQDRLAGGLQKADGYGFRALRDLRAFIRLIFEIGPNFDDYPPFQSILRAPDTPSCFLLPALFEHASGPDWVSAAVYDIVSRSLQVSCADAPNPQSISLKPLAREHAEPYFRQSLHPDVWRLANLTPFRSVAQAEEYFNSLETQAVEGYAIVDSMNGFLGTVMVDHRDEFRRVFYWTGRSFWGHGIATAALSQQLHMLSGNTDRTPIVAGLYSGNLPSRRVLEKCGFFPCTADCTSDSNTLNFRYDPSRMKASNDKQR